MPVHRMRGGQGDKRADRHSITPKPPSKLVAAHHWKSRINETDGLHPQDESNNRGTGMDHFRWLPIKTDKYRYHRCRGVDDNHGYILLSIISKNPTLTARF